MTKKIIYIRQNKPGGTDNYCKALFRLFQNDPVLEPQPICDIPTIHSRLFHYYYLPSALKEAIKRADIVHINGYTAMGTVQAILTAKGLQKTIAYTAHWHPFKCLRHPVFGKFFFNLILRPLVKRYVDVVFTINNEDTKFFKMFHHNVIQIPHFYIPLNINSHPVKKKNMVLFVGRTDDPVKGMEHLYQIPEGTYDIHCIGKGMIERKDFHQHTNIPDEELAALYSEAAVLVIPSKYEAFSYVALEALSYGTPVVMSERVRIADYLSGCQGVFIFKYGDYQDFKNKIDSAIGTTPNTQFIYQKFSADKVKQEYRTAYIKAKKGR